jgi:F-type H+-transporting ATPase subunit b
MLSIAIATATAAESSAGPVQLMHRFGIEPIYLIMQVISFGILAYVLYRFMIKPVVATMDERQKKIEAGLKDAADIRAKLSATQQETMQVLQKAHSEAADIIDKARRTSKELADREQVLATERANDVITKAKQAIELEHKRMIQEARGEITRLVVATTQKVLSKELSDFERARFNEAAAKELTNN